MSEDYGVPQVEEKKTLLTGKLFYKFIKQEYQTREEAENARRSEIKSRAKQAELMKEIESSNSEMERRKSEIEADLKLRRAEYDSDPVYMSVNVRCKYIADVKDTFWSGTVETGLAAWVDLDALNNGIYEACRELSIHGYDVISITSAISGVGSYKIIGGNNNSGGAGWGYSFTNGAVVTGRKRDPSIPTRAGDASLENKKCPSCAETVKFEAIKCHFCGHAFDPVELKQQLEERRAELTGLVEERQTRIAAEVFYAKPSGLKQCPGCKKWDVRQGANIEDGSSGDWCPHCNMSLQKMAGKI